MSLTLTLPKAQPIVILVYETPLHELNTVNYTVSDECLAIIKQVVNLDRQGRIIRLYCP